jgi:hypothetical protein
MKKVSLLLAVASILMTVMLITSCSTPATITSWKNPQVDSKISKVVVMAVADKMTYSKPAEQIIADYFTQHNLPSVMAMNYLDPFTQYTMDQIKEKLDPIGADAILLLSSKGKDVSLNYDPGFYGGYRGAWGGVWGVGGTYSTSTTYTIRASLYDVSSGKMIWSGDVQVTDPNDTSTGMTQVAQVIYNDWVKNQVLKNPPPPAAK